MSRLDPELLELAASCGVSTDFYDWQGQPTLVRPETVRAVLAALGVDASTAEETRAALDARRTDAWRRMLPPSLVIRGGWTPWVRVHIPHGERVHAWVELEDGTVRGDVVQQDVFVEPRDIDGQLVGEATFEVPGDLPLGYHRLHAAAAGKEATCALIVTPSYLGLPEHLRWTRTWGFMTQLYAARSQRSWGFGDLADLTELAGWSARELGAGFVLVNPLHSADPVPPIEPSPYLPSTRRFFSPLYLRIEEIPEYDYLPAADRSKIERTARGRRAKNQSDLIDRDAVWKAKRSALALLHAVPRTAVRNAAYVDFLRREGSGLLDFATWCALAEVHGSTWEDWPAALQDPRSPAVAQARAELAEQVDLHCWLQWLLDEQLAHAQRTAVTCGMPIGIVHDLAVGVHPEGADSWFLQDVLAQRVTVGAPPDAFNQQGQDWSQPPWRPDRLAELGYAPYRDMLRTILRHAGGIRVDHVTGLFRLWWVPEGAPADQGAYVRYDSEALVGILALEAFRAGAVVVGEDLGTVEPWVRDYLGERGILGTSILWFEMDQEGQPLPPQRWRELCLATVTTHDLPPTAGYLAGEHIRIRDELGLLTRDVAEERRVDTEDRTAWLDVARREGVLPADADEQQTVEGLHRLLLHSPCRLLGVALPDAIGDRRAVNQPGTTDEYPNWRVPLADGSGRPVLLEEIVASTRARSLAAAVSGAPVSRTRDADATVSP